MAVALKSELHRLVESIPETQPEVANALIELMFLLVAASRQDEQRFDELVSEIGELQARSKDTADMMVRIRDLQNRWALPNDDAERLWQILQAAPPDDEPLTAEEIEMLDRARASIASGSTISHDELGRLLES